MWRGFDEFKFSTQEWVDHLYVDPYRKAHYLYIINRALRKAVRDKVILRQEQQNLWKMINSSEEDAYIALTAIENKYKQLIKNTGESCNY